MADTFHQAAVTSDDLCKVIDQIAAELGGKVMFRHRHADRIRDALAQWAGGGFNAACMSSLGMAGGDRAQLTEIAQLVHRHVGIAGEYEWLSLMQLYYHTHLQLLMYLCKPQNLLSKYQQKSCYHRQIRSIS